MTAVRDFSGNEMKIVSSSHLSFENSKIPGTEFFGYGNQFCDVIENADGVPFQLIFGSKAGEGYYINIGEGIRNMLGVDPQSFTERTFIDMVEETVPLADGIPGDISESRKKFINGEIDKYRVEVRVTTPAGEKKWIRDSSVPLKDESTGKIIGSFGILFDITDRKIASINLKMAMEKADESERLKTAFLNNISHEVRTPLNAIIGFSTLLCEPEQGIYRKKEFIKIINNSTDHFLETMDNILEISRIEAGTVTTSRNEVHCNQLINSIYNKFRQPAADKNIHLACNIPDNETLIETDVYKLTQVLANLLGNAVKFTLKGQIEFGYRIKGRIAEFFVSDTGIGITEMDKRFVFDKFFQAESGMTRRFPGTGLGLAISKKYVELMGGSIDFTSVAGEGSTFRFTLPA